MPGFVTNGFADIQPLVLNGTTISPVPYTNLTAASSRIPVDTETASGQQPQTVNASPFDIAACAMAMINNTATSTVHAATLNTTSGMLVTEALTTAAGADYTFTLTNSQIAATTNLQVQMHDGTNSAGGVAVKSVTCASGSAVLVFTNTGTAAFNGTKLIGFHI